MANNYFCLVNNPIDADWIIIPLFITELSNKEGRKYIRRVSDLARKTEKPLGLFSNSDFIIDLEVDNAYLFTPGSYRSKPFQIDLPATLNEDPYQKWIGGDWSPLLYNSKPSVGFCGQATLHPLKAFKDFYTFTKAKILNKSGLTLSNPGAIFLPAFQRARLLKLLEKDSRFATDFILRRQYKGGSVTKEQNFQVESEFYNNICNNLFTVCLRGMGNYSVRFYQTLAMGRIPILIETDCNISYEDFNQLDKIIPVIPYSQRNKITDIVYEYFVNKTPEELALTQSKCRQIWLEYYTKEGLVKYIHKSMNGKLPIQ